MTALETAVENLVAEAQRVLAAGREPEVVEAIIRLWQRLWYAVRVSRDGQ